MSLHRWTAREHCYVAGAGRHRVTIVILQAPADIGGEFQRNSVSAYGARDDKSRGKKLQPTTIPEPPAISSKEARDTRKALAVSKALRQSARIEQKHQEERLAIKAMLMTEADRVSRQLPL